MVNALDFPALVSNNNTGIEYEYALYYCLSDDREKKIFKKEVIYKHRLSSKILKIISYTNIGLVLREVNNIGYSISSCDIETQNDYIGPSDLVLHLKSSNKVDTLLGISVKYANTCTLNISGCHFLGDSTIKSLKYDLFTTYSTQYINEMKKEYGSVSCWFRKRKRSSVTDHFIYIIIQTVIKEWATFPITKKQELISLLFQQNPEIKYWIFEYELNHKCVLFTNPIQVSPSLVDRISLIPYKTSYIGFYLNLNLIGRMQVKFNNGFLEKGTKSSFDFIVDNIYMKIGQPFTSWNFSVNY